MLEDLVSSGCGYVPPLKWTCDLSMVSCKNAVVVSDLANNVVKSAGISVRPVAVLVLKVSRVDYLMRVQPFMVILTLSGSGNSAV